ncbi:unnamed protein product, partial [Notodromas monacha]
MSGFWEPTSSSSAWPSTTTRTMQPRFDHRWHVSLPGIFPCAASELDSAAAAAAAVTRRPGRRFVVFDNMQTWSIWPLATTSSGAQIFTFASAPVVVPYKTVHRVRHEELIPFEKLKITPLDPYESDNLLRDRNQDVRIRNILHDPRVMRGSTMAFKNRLAPGDGTSPLFARGRYNGADGSTIEGHRSQRNSIGQPSDAQRRRLRRHRRRTKRSSPPPVDGREHADSQTEIRLEELRPADGDLVPSLLSRILAEALEEVEAEESAGVVARRQAQLSMLRETSAVERVRVLEEQLDTAADDGGDTDGDRVSYNFRV